MFCRSFSPVAILTTTLALVSCGPSSEGGSTADSKTQPAVKRLAYLAASTAHTFELAQLQALTLLVGRNQSFVLEAHDAQGRADKQLSQWHDAIAAKPFAIIVQPVDQEALAPFIPAAVNSGTLVVGLGRQMLDTGCSTVAWCDQTELGRLAGQVAVRALTIRAAEEEKAEVTGRIVQIRGEEDSATCAERNAGFLEIIRTAPGLLLVHDAPGGWTKEGGFERTQDALRLQSQFDVIYAHNDLMALGAAQAAGALREEMLIIGTDGFGGPTGGMTLVANGDIDATIFQPLLVDFAWRLVRKKAADAAFQPKASYQLTPRAISAKDIDEIRRNGLPKFPEL